MHGVVSSPAWHGPEIDQLALQRDSFLRYVEQWDRIEDSETSERGSAIARGSLGDD